MSVCFLFSIVSCSLQNIIWWLISFEIKCIV